MRIFRSAQIESDPIYFALSRLLRCSILGKTQRFGAAHEPFFCLYPIHTRISHRQR
jgi:hypothetical protein